MPLAAYTFFDTTRGDILFTGQTIVDLLANAEEPVALNLPGDTTGKFLKWNVAPDLLDVRGQTKLILRPTAEAFGVQIKTEYTGVDAEHNAAEVTADWRGDGNDGGGLRAFTALARVYNGNKIEGTANLIGTRSIVQAGGGGEVDGSGLHAADYALVEDGGTWTSVGHLAARWADSHLAAAPGAGNLSLDYLSNNGAAQFDQVSYIYGNDKITNLFTLDTVAGMASVAGASSTQAGGIRVVVEGQVRYIPLYSDVPA